MSFAFSSASVFSACARSSILGISHVFVTARPRNRFSNFQFSYWRYFSEQLFVGAAYPFACACRLYCRTGGPMWTFFYDMFSLMVPGSSSFSAVLMDACCVCQTRFSHSPCVRSSASMSSACKFLLLFESVYVYPYIELMKLISVEQNTVVKFLYSYRHGRLPLATSTFQRRWSWCLTSCGCIARGLVYLWARLQQGCMALSLTMPSVLIACFHNSNALSNYLQGYDNSMYIYIYICLLLLLLLCPCETAAVCYVSTTLLPSAHVKGIRLSLS